MSRLSVLANRPKRVLGALALLLLAVGVAVGSGANFSAVQSANPSNDFSSGTLSIDNGNEGAAILTAANMKPGDGATGTVKISNSGSLAGGFSLSGRDNASASQPFLNSLDLVVTDCHYAPACDGTGVNAPSNVYTGKMSLIGSNRSLGNYASNAYHYYKFDVTFPGSAGNSLQGKSASFEFNWDAVQS